MHQVFIDGKEGTTGLRIYERMQSREDVALLALSDEERKDPVCRREMIEAADIVFLCLPDEAACEAAKWADGSKARVIDASSAHRTAEGWIYGFPELGLYEAIRKSKRVAVPGCHASGFIALTYPLIEAGVLESDAALSCLSVTGYSGGGKKMIAAYEDAQRDKEYDSPRNYGLKQQHKHLPEIECITGLTPVFVPVVADFYAGMAVTVPLNAKTLKKHTTPEEIVSIYKEFYRDRPMMQIFPFTGEDGYFAANVLAGKDKMQLTVTGNAQRFCLMARYDNLGKGASGAAIQCMNIMLGEEEIKGLAL